MAMLDEMDVAAFSAQSIPALAVPGGISEARQGFPGTAPQAAPIAPVRDAAELLRAAAYRAGQPGAWTQHFLSRSANGRSSYVRRMPAAAGGSYCMLGALYQEYDREYDGDCGRDDGGVRSRQIHAAYRAIVQAIGTELIAVWNDAPGRTQDDVVTALIHAAEIAAEIAEG